MPKINVNLGVTLCTDPDNRNFLRIGIEAQGIDVDGDAREQAQACLTCAIEVIHVLDDGLQEAIVDVISDTGKVGLVKETLEAHSDQIGRIGRALRAGLNDIASLKLAQAVIVASDAEAEDTTEPGLSPEPSTVVEAAKKGAKSKSKAKVEGTE